MKNLTLIGSIILIIVVLGAGAFFLLLRGSFSGTSDLSGTAPGGVYPTQTTVVTPVGSLSGGESGGGTSQPAGTLTVTGATGGTITVKDFKEDPSTVPFPNDTTHYVLAGGLSPSENNTPYTILYVESDQSFTVSLLTEPLADIRHLAEQDLMDRLGINQVDACSLRYSVLVPYKVSAIYAGKNLGFSFCPGATKL